MIYRVHFNYMGVTWSAGKSAYAEFVRAAERNEPINLETHASIYQLRRHEPNAPTLCGVELRTQE